MFDMRDRRDKAADTAIMKQVIDSLGITEATPVGVARAFESFDSSYQILVGVGLSELDKGAKHLVIERHQVPAGRSRRPGGNWRDQFRLTGEYYGSTDPTFLGFVTPAPDCWQASLGCLASGQMKEIPVSGLKFFERSIT